MPIDLTKEEREVALRGVRKWIGMSSLERAGSCPFEKVRPDTKTAAEFVEVCMATCGTLFPLCVNKVEEYWNSVTCPCVVYGQRTVSEKVPMIIIELEGE